MDEARARRLQPHYIEWRFRAAFTRLGGRIRRREQGRYEITHVPARARAQQARGPIATRYDRVTFDIEHVLERRRAARADLLAPGHPLHDAVMDAGRSPRWPAPSTAAPCWSPPRCEEPRLLVGVIEEIVDATETSVARRFGYAYVDSTARSRPAGPAPYLDCVAAP